MFDGFELKFDWRALASPLAGFDLIPIDSPLVARRGKQFYFGSQHGKVGSWTRTSDWNPQGKRFSPAEVAAMVRMARAKSSAVLASAKQKAGDSYRAQIVFAARSLELDSVANRAAVTLLNLIPHDADQQSIWTTLGDSMCSGETVSDMKSLGQLGERLPRGLARAVLLVPNRMRDYVAYSLVSAQDPHSDYAG